MKHIQTLIFDLGGVLVNLDIPRFEQSFVDLGMHDVDFNFLQGHLKPLFLGYEQGTVTTDEFVSTLIKECKPGTTEQDVMDAWNSMLEIIPDEKLETLRSLHASYTIFLLSNTNELHWKYTVETCLEKYGFRVEDYFDRVFLSYEMKDYKPSLSIYKKLIADSGISAPQALFLDDRKENIDGALQCGLQGLVVDPYRKDENGHFQKPAHCWTDELRFWLF